MDLGALPPELSSALIYTGPGSGPMVAAASAWNGLAAELNSAAVAYDAVITQLSSEEWLGPASAAMAEAAQPYVAWMSTTGAQAEQAATQATAAAAAYETAFAGVVPPPLIAENRASLAQALTTNVFGQNMNIIAALQAQYGEMWAQNAQTLYQYAASSANATSGMTTFSQPPQVANPAASATQAATVAQAAAAPAGSAAGTVNNLATQINSQLAALANPATDSTSAQLSNLLGLPTVSLSTSNFLTFPTNSIAGSIATGLGGSNVISPAWFITVFRNFAGPAYNIEGLPYFSTGMANTMLSLSKGLAPAAAAAGGTAAHGLAGLGGMMGGGAGPAGVAGVSAALGQAASIGGKLSVPTAFSGVAPAVGHAAAPLPVSTISAAPEGAGGAGNLLGGMPLAGVGAGAGAGTGPRYGFRPTIMARPPFAG